ncbi:MAG: FtsX-like permease family protein [Mycobacteriales bacterium]
MSALGKIVRAGVGRRRVQTLVITLTTMMSVTASVLAAGLLVASQGPFDHAFARQRGAHLTGQFDGRKATAGQVAATAHVSGVTAAAGPYPVLSLHPSAGTNQAGMPADATLPPMTFVGRAGAGGPVDDVEVDSGHWVTGTGQVVLAEQGPPFQLGDTLRFPDLAGAPTLTVVGIARSVAQSADAWVSPAQLAALTAPGTVPDHQMLYRFAHAATNAQVNADRAAVAAAAPAGSLTGAASYLKIKKANDREAAAYVPFVVAFGVLGMAMSVLIIGIVVSGAVGAATRRIGILKSLGFTPAQVARGYIAQALIPATVGIGFGVVLGNLLAVPVMADEGKAYQTGTPGIAPWLDVAVPAAALAAVVLTALVPALRAGRLRTVEAIAVGRTPSAGRGRLVRYLLGRLPLPRAMSLGLANPFGRPARSATMLVAVMFGAVGVTFGVGLATSLNAVQHGLDRDQPGAVAVESYLPPDGAGPEGAGPGGPVPGGAVPGGPVRRGTAQAGPADVQAADPAAVAAAIRRQPGTRGYFSTGQGQVGVAGLAGATNVTVYEGDSSWGAYQMISGRWFHRTGEAVAPSGFLDATGTHVGSTVTLTAGGRSVRVRIVGEVLHLRDEGMEILTDRASLAGLGADAVPVADEFHIDLAPGTRPQAYVETLNTALHPIGAEAIVNAARVSSTVIAMDTLAAILTTMLVAVAGLGVLNTVVLDTRERVHDLGVFKALGMAPRQTVAMVVTSVAGIGVVAGVAGVPIGVALHHVVLPAMARAAGSRLPAADLAVYHPVMVLGLAAGGLVIAVAGALLPAGWAAKTRTATALRTE